MQKGYLLVAGVVAGAALFSAQQGPACPYADAERAAAEHAQTAAVDGAPAAGSVFYLGHSEAFAP